MTSSPRDTDSTGEPVALVWDERVVDYDFGPRHPLRPVRVELTRALLRSSDLLVGGAVEVTPEPTGEDALLRVHRESYVEAVQALSVRSDPERAAGCGLGAGDTPAFRGMHEAALRVCDATVDAARRVWTGEVAHAFNPGGGLHHAMPGRAAGFCVYNDPGVAIAWLLDQGAERVCYVDVDAHHGDGVEAMFRDDPRVLTVSLHESGQFLFPGTGAVDDIGPPHAKGSVVNLPLHPATTGEIWLEVFDAVADPIIRAFDADVLVTQLGCDSHHLDPLAHLSLTIDDMAGVYTRLHRLAHDVTQGRWIATGGGGYRLVDVVPRAWTLAFAEMSGNRLPVETPFDWRELVAERTGERAPGGFTEDPVRPAPELLERARRGAARTIDAARRGSFRLHGIDG
ncbi:MAG: acetoin utilization protein AcuC [Nitriliruptoraceae bacterium]